MVTIVSFSKESTGRTTLELPENAQSLQPEPSQHPGGHPWKLRQLVKKLAALVTGSAERNHTQATIELGF
jgi:hypothetical protein